MKNAKPLVIHYISTGGIQVERGDGIVCAHAPKDPTYLGEILDVQCTGCFSLQKIELIQRGHRVPAHHKYYIHRASTCPFAFRRS